MTSVKNPVRPGSGLNLNFTMVYLATARTAFNASRSKAARDLTEYGASIGDRGTCGAGADGKRNLYHRTNCTPATIKLI